MAKREQALPPAIVNSALAGRVFWITGLAGAGKSSVAGALRTRLADLGMAAILLDGDRLRAIFGGPARYDPDSRRQLAYRYARLCRELAEQGCVVICATISMFHEVQAWNRTHIPGYVEIYLRVPLAVLKQRNQKGLYGPGEAKDGPVAGLDFAAEEPIQPDLIIDHHGDIKPEAAARLIVEKFFA
ncbi:MAG: adenylyl-sulfate kinase [Rhodospirillaceae bacterium]|nr:adenylyl-sulfate kinase [Rhodospirillaceae bacterium]